MQHIGLATKDMDRSLKLYRKLFGMDIPFFDSIQDAPLMDGHTRGETISKRASMVLNLQGGCAFEVLRAASFEPVAANWKLGMGDLGISTVQMKTRNISRMHEHARSVLGDDCDRKISVTPWGDDTFYLKDCDGNVFQILEASDWFGSTGHPSGGVMGCSIGVSDMDKSLALYADNLGFDQVLFDETDTFSDWQHLVHGAQRFRRVRLTQSSPGSGGFGTLTGRTYIELIQAEEREGKFIFQDRIWCDLGFAHLGFDVRGMRALEAKLEQQGFPFRCDTADAIGMGETKVHCTYIDDPDECWLEMIEVYKVPIIEKWGIFLDVQKRGQDEPLPRWMLKSLRFSRIKD
ncbi:VOC family protein [Flavobacteriales bacterium]|nr:VOC family protein [Flavobacteriales bacterium]